MELSDRGFTQDGSGEIDSSTASEPCVNGLDADIPILVRFRTGREVSWPEGVPSVVRRLMCGGDALVGAPGTVRSKSGSLRSRSLLAWLSSTVPL